MTFFFYFQYGFSSSRSTPDLLTVVSNRIARAFNRFWATRYVALDMSKAFDRVWHVGLLHKPKSMEFQVMMPSVILLSMLMILLSILSVIRYLISMVAT